MHKEFEGGGTALTTYVINNEASKHLKVAMKDKKIKYQLATPHMHRANTAKRAIQTFNHHFKAILASMDPAFPMVQWDRLLEQVQLTLNLLRSSRTSPSMSAHASIFDKFDFRANLLAPPGTRVVAHTKPGAHSLRSLNGEDGWYVGPAMNHYRNANVYFPKTQTVRPVDTVKFYLTMVTMPRVKIEDHLRQATSDIVWILKIRQENLQRNTIGMKYTKQYWNLETYLELQKNTHDGKYKKKLKRDTTCASSEGE